MTTTEKLVHGGLSAGQAKAIVGDADSGVTATGSSSQANSYAIGASFTEVTGGGATTGVRLPVANKGDKFYIYNASGSNCLIYPPTGGDLNDGSDNAAITLADNETACCICRNSTSDYAVMLGDAS